MGQVKKKVLVVGDIMLDRYVICDHIGQSPEADIPLLRQRNIENRLGGAANVCHNLISLGMDVNLIAVCGDDEEAVTTKLLLDELEIHYFISIDPNRPTTVKLRTVDKDFNQFFRLDNESYEKVDQDIEAKVLANLNKHFSEHIPEAVVIQDYNKGLLTETIIQTIQSKCQKFQIPLFVDPKKNHFALLSKCDYFKPNLKELSAWVGQSISPDMEDLNRVIANSCLSKTKNIFITLAENGIFYHESSGFGGIISGHDVQEADVSGAGDTVLAALVFASLNKLTIKEIAMFANDKGAEVCRKPGVSTVSNPTNRTD